MDTDPVRRKFMAALDALVEQIKQDRSILAAILCGSLSHDTVWAKSDIDLVLVTDRRSEGPTRPRVALRRRRQRPRVPDAARGVPQDRRRLAAQLVHAFAAGQGPAALHARRDHRRPLRAAARDRRARHAAAAAARGDRTRCRRIDKAHKWFVTRGDLDYTALWILYAATPLARIEVIGAGLLADREVIPQAMKLNPAFFKTVYTDLLNAKKTREGRAGGARRDRRLHRGARRRRCSRRCSSTCARSAKPARPPRSRTTSSATSASSGVTTACEYLADQGLHRQGVDAGAADEAEQRRRAGAGVLLPARTAAMTSKRTPSRRPRTTIAVQGARVHNLKNISRRDPARQPDRRHRAVGLRQVEPGLRHDLRRRTAALHGVALELRQAVRRAGREARRRLRLRPVAGDLDRAEDASPAIRARPSAP